MGPIVDRRDFAPQSCPGCEKRGDNVSGFERRLDARLVVSIVAVGIMSFAGEAVETAMNVAFPALMGEFGVNTATVQWVTAGYLLVLSAIMPVSSFLNRRFRARTLFLAAMLTFLAGTIMSAAALHFALLIGGRILQGIGTGVALPLMFNIVLQQVPHERMGTMMGLATLITAIAPAVGPSLGGFLRRARVAFDFPGARSLPGHRPGARGPDDPPGPGDQAGFLRPRPVPAHGGRVRRPRLRH